MNAPKEGFKKAEQMDRNIDLAALRGEFENFIIAMDVNFTLHTVITNNYFNQHSITQNNIVAGRDEDEDEQFLLKISF